MQLHLRGLGSSGKLWHCQTLCRQLQVGGANARRRLLRAFLVVRKFRLRQWLVIVERQFFGLIKLFGIFVGKFVLEQLVGKLLNQQRIIRKFIGTFKQYPIE